MPSFDDLVVSLLLLAVFLLVAFPIHEFAHAVAAFRLGDHTARMFGRLTLDPRAHFDPMGGLILAFTILFTSFGFGWAKPTPVNPMNLRGGRWGEAIVAAAGPASNLVLAVAGALPLRYVLATQTQVPDLFLTFLFFFVYINLILMVFNFLPIPPLDGSKVLFAFLEPRTAWRVRPVLEQYGFLILLLAIFPLFGGQSLLGLVFGAIVDPVFAFLVGVSI
jgi:Zn-dependent protease